MNTIFQLHNAARRYCIDHQNYWWSAYQTLNDENQGRVGSGYSEKALDTFPRYQILRAILTEIERINVDELPDYSELLEHLIIVGQVAQSLFTKSPTGEIEATAIQDERDKFIETIRGFTLESIATVPVLPYRRVLSATEVARLWKRVKARWGADGNYFYPLAEITEPSLFAFDELAFDKAFPTQRLRSILRSREVERLYELREYGDENYLMSIDFWEPYYNGAEGFWFSEALDWIMYASHENSITTGGILTQLIRAEWKDANQHEWVIYI